MKSASSSKSRQIGKLFLFIKQLYRVEDELKRNLAQQKIENVKLNNNISTLKQEKTQL